MVRRLQVPLPDPKRTLIPIQLFIASEGMPYADAAYDADYYRLVDWLDVEPLFKWKNLSIPEDNALREDKGFESRLRKRLGESDILLVIVGMEIAHRYWIKWEIKWARTRGIPIVGVMPNGRVRIPKVVEDARCPTVGWRLGSVIGVIRQLALDRR